MEEPRSPALDLDAQLLPHLADLDCVSLRRRRRTVASVAGARISVEGRELIDFSSNDYLGLAGHPDVAASARRATERWGTGARASHLISGHTEEHAALERALAEVTGRERALVFSTGYMANAALASALLRPGDHVALDRLVHASIIDAVRGSGARFRRYAHGEVGAAARVLGSRRAGEARRRLLWTDGVFSMDGDIAPLPALAELCRETGSVLVVDDAHGFGVLNAACGSVDAALLSAGDTPVYMGTLGKAMGCAGAFVAGSAALIDTLVQHGRAYAYTTAQPPALAAATRRALELSRKEGWRRDQLKERIALFRNRATSAGLPITDSRTPIQPVIVGDARRAMRLAAALEDEGLLVAAIRPPTVPQGSARLRITLSAVHERRWVTDLVDVLARSWEACA